jgi:hypothetical protein
MEEATACDWVGGTPKLEYAVHIKKVSEEVAMLVVALTGTSSTKDGGERGEFKINCFRFIA